MPGTANIMAAAVEGAQVDFDDALEIEGRYFVDAGDRSGREEHDPGVLLRPEPGQRRPRPSGRISETYKAKKVVVLGAGMMGAAIAYVSAKVGIEVVLKDVSLEAAERGKGYREKLVAKAVEKGRTSQEDGDALLARILPTDKPEDAAGADLVIEAVFEDPKVKEQVLEGDRAARRCRRAAGLQHLDPADHRPGRVRHPPR